MDYKRIKFTEYLECAEVINTHGVNGVLKLRPMTDTPEVLCGIRTMYFKSDSLYVPYTVKQASVQKGMTLIRFAEINTLDDAIKLKGKTLYANRSDLNLSEGSFFIADIIGIDVYDYDTGEQIGIIDCVLSPVGQQVYVIKKESGYTFMVPCAPEFIKKVSFGENCNDGVYVSLIEGMDNEN